LRNLVKLIRTYIAYCFVRLGEAVAPWPRPSAVNEKVEEPAPVIPPAPAEEKKAPPPPMSSIPYANDMASYAEKLGKPSDVDAAAISICNNLKEISANKKSPVRLMFTLNSYYDEKGEKQMTNSANISAYGKGRWYKLRDIPVEAAVLGALIREMIEAQAQDGWACMNDSAEQLSGYLGQCLANNRKYLLQYCKLHKTQGRIRAQISMVADVNVANAKHSDIPPPHIMNKVSVWNGNTSEPIESAHFVYFMRSEKETAKA
jgi:hypothetical protein